MAQHLQLYCEMLVVACRPAEKDFDLVLRQKTSSFLSLTCLT